MEQVQLRPAKGKGSRSKRAVCLLLIALAILAGALIYGIFWQFSLVLRLNGEEKMTAEYGENFQEPGVKPELIGKFLWKTGFSADTPIQVTGQVDTSRLGEQLVTYSAKFGPWSAQAQRRVLVVDTQPPVITLTPDSEATKVRPGARYVDAGYSAWDNRDGDLTDKVIRNEEEGTVYYAVVDSSGNPAYASREIPYLPYSDPEILLPDGEDVTFQVGTRFEAPLYQAIGGDGADITEAVEVSGTLDIYLPGDYTLTYSVTDGQGMTAQTEQHIHVTAAPAQTTNEPAGKVIYLTFDDGPGPYTRQLLDTLDEYGVKATFFVVNTGYDDVLREIVSRGHSIGVHSMSHKYDEIYASPEAFYSDLLGMQQKIYEKTGVRTWLMRFPGGSSNTISHFSPGIMTLLTQSVEAAGFRYFDWNVDSNDAGGARKASQVLKNVQDGVSRQRISLVLQHDIHPFSVEAVADILKWGQENGYQFLPLEMDSPAAHHGVNN